MIRRDLSTLQITFMIWREGTRKGSFIFYCMRFSQ